MPASAVSSVPPQIFHTLVLTWDAPSKPLGIVQGPIQTSAATGTGTKSATGTGRCTIEHKKIRIKKKERQRLYGVSLSDAVLNQLAAIHVQLNRFSFFSLRSTS
jgi:hypothetical protein